jgi:hypothetical protein
MREDEIVDYLVKESVTFVSQYMSLLQSPINKLRVLNQIKEELETKRLGVIENEIFILNINPSDSLSQPTS